ncbi:hypothetical protein D3C71_1063260 [compost metagenome]
MRQFLLTERTVIIGMAQVLHTLPNPVTVPQVLDHRRYIDILLADHFLAQDRVLLKRDQTRQVKVGDSIHG